MRSVRSLVAVAVFVGALALPLMGAEARPTRRDPALSVPTADLDAALHCPAGFDGSGRGEPVLLVHGTFTNGEENYSWNYLAELPLLGFDVCYVNLPQRSMGDIQVASEYVVHAIRRMRAISGERVDILGHSQGGLEPRWALRWWTGTRRQVDDLVTLATPHHGTALASQQDGETPVTCPACRQMSPESQFIALLNSVDETPGDVSYTSIYSELFDELVQPPETAILAGGTSIAVQDVCPARFVDHISIAADDAVYRMVLDAFTNPGPTNVARLPLTTCLGTFFPRQAGLQGFLDTFADSITNPQPFPFPEDDGQEPEPAPYTQV